MSAHGTPTSSSSAKMRSMARSTRFSAEATSPGSLPRHRTRHRDGAHARRPHARPIRGSDIPGDSRRSRCRSMRSATAMSADAMRNFSVGVSRPGSDMVQGYRGSHTERGRERDTNSARTPQLAPFSGICGCDRCSRAEALSTIRTSPAAIRSEAFGIKLGLARTPVPRGEDDPIGWWHRASDPRGPQVSPIQMSYGGGVASRERLTRRCAKPQRGEAPARGWGV
jgi:hypothetical protein